MSYLNILTYLKNLTCFLKCLTLSHSFDLLKTFFSYLNISAYYLNILTSLKIQLLSENDFSKLRLVFIILTYYLKCLTYQNDL